MELHDGGSPVKSCGFWRSAGGYRAAPGSGTSKGGFVVSGLRADQRPHRRSFLGQTRPRACATDRGNTSGPRGETPGTTAPGAAIATRTDDRAAGVVAAPHG